MSFMAENGKRQNVYEIKMKLKLKKCHLKIHLDVWDFVKTPNCPQNLLILHDQH